MAINPISTSGLAGIRRHSADFERAAEKIARAGAPDAAAHDAAAAQSEAAPVENAFLDGTVELMVAQRMFTASLRVAQAANEGIMEALRSGGCGTATAA